jgi:uncharacterized protein YggU (UPF0235/DUF167 family)
MIYNNLKKKIINIIKINCKIYLKKEKNKIELDESGSLKIYINAIGEKRKANKAIIEIILKFFFIKKYNITILSGFCRLNKLIEIRKEKTREE